MKTIALWYHEDRYLTEILVSLRSHASHGGRQRNRAHRLRSHARTGQVFSTVDGKDNAGKIVKVGTYTVYLEVAGEHGSHQLMKKEFNFDGTPDRIAFRANTELAGASFDYHKLPQK